MYSYLGKMKKNTKIFYPTKNFIAKSDAKIGYLIFVNHTPFYKLESDALTQIQQMF